MEMCNDGQFLREVTYRICLIQLSRLTFSDFQWSLLQEQFLQLWEVARLASKFDTEPSKFCNSLNDL